jgi:hypothetical protein
MRNFDNTEKAAAAVSELDCPGAVLAPREVRISRTFEEVEVLRDEWSSRKTHRDSDIDHFVRLVPSTQEFIRPHVITIHNGDQLEAILVGWLRYADIRPKIGYFRIPYARVRLLNFSYRGFLGNPSDKSAAELVGSVLASLRDKEADVAMFHQSDVGSPIYESAIKMASSLSRDYLARPSLHHFMRLSGTFNEVSRRLSSSLRKELRRKKEKMIEDFGGRFLIRRFSEPADLDEALPLLEEIAKKTYQRGLHVGFEDTPETRRRLTFFAQSGWLRIHVLLLADKPCAFSIGTLYRGSFSSDEVGFDPQFSFYSPGKVLLFAMVEEFSDSGVEEIDFGSGEAEYKARFGNFSSEEASVYVFAPHARGLVLNGLRTAAGLLDLSAKKLLGRSNLLPKIKKIWRGTVSKNSNRII